MLPGRSFLARRCRVVRFRPLLLHSGTVAACHDMRRCPGRICAGHVPCASSPRYPALCCLPHPSQKGLTAADVQAGQDITPCPVPGTALPSRRNEQRDSSGKTAARSKVACAVCCRGCLPLPGQKGIVPFANNACRICSKIEHTRGAVSVTNFVKKIFRIKSRQLRGLA